MVNRQKKKTRRLRGYRTAGYGAGKKHRGKGNRGGKGMAGSGKRGQHAIQLRQAMGRFLGKRGMRPRHARAEQYALSLGRVEQNLENWLARGLVKKEKDTYIVDAKSLGADKITCAGEVKHKFKITAQTFSAPAEEKIKQAGGEAIKLTGNAE